MLHKNLHLQTKILPLTIDNWILKLEQPISRRPFYQIKQHTFQMGQVVVRFLGLPFDEDEYYNNLYDCMYARNTQLQLLEKTSLRTEMDPSRQALIKELLNRYKDEKFSIESLVALFYDEQLLIKTNSRMLQNKLLEACVRLFKTILLVEMNDDIDRQSEMITQICYWMHHYVKEPVKQIKLEDAMPKFLWYGAANQAEQYFLYFLIQLGCDLVIFTPSGEDVLATFDPNGTLGLIHRYPKNGLEEPFPHERRRRSATVAYRASQEIEAMLNHEGSGLYKPWQLRDYTPMSLTYKTTYDEMFLLAKEKAMIRPHFRVKDGYVRIPVVFSKVQGVSKNRKEYWKRIHALILSKNTLLIKQFPFKSYVNSDFRFHYDGALGEDGLLQPEVMMRSRYWRYGHLSMGLQRGIAYAVKNICRQSNFKPIHRETQKDVSVFLFTQSMQVPAPILKLLQTFDYSQEIPKLVLYNNGLHGTLSRTDAAMLLLLNQFGIDIVIYNPAGLNDIEKYIEESVYDIHWLEDVVFEQEFREPSFLKKLFSGHYFN